MPHQIVQACHACLEAGVRFSLDAGKPSYLIACGVADEPSLRHVKRWLELRGIRVLAFQEPDLRNELTALASEPVADERRKLFSRFKLWKGE